MELAVFQMDGTKTSRSITLDNAIFGAEPNDHAIYLDTKQYMANQRQGTHDTLEKSAVSGSTKKLKRQKGTGTARSGSIKSPLFRGGGRIFGPHPRDYDFKVNKKVKRLARVSALSYKAKDNEIIILDDLKFEKPRTKNFIELLKSFETGNKKALFVVPASDRNIFLSSRNLQQVKIMNATDINTYDILKHNRLFIVEGSLKDIEKVLAE
jgi:large subunit ribosomal protein L4